MQAHCAKLAVVKAVEGTHSCKIINVGKLYFDFLNFFLQIDLVEEMTGEYVLQLFCVILR